MTRPAFLALACIFWLATVWPAATWAEGYTVKPKDTLAAIADKLKPDKSMKRAQVMLALLQANPAAFTLSCNLYSLRPGALLNLPALEQIRAIPAADAAKEIKRQEQAWKDSRKKKNPKPIVCPQPAPPDRMSPPVADPQASAESLPSPAEAPELKPALPDRPAPPPTEPQASAESPPAPVEAPEPRPAKPEAAPAGFGWEWLLVGVTLALLLGIWAWGRWRIPAQPLPTLPPSLPTSPPPLPPIETHDLPPPAAPLLLEPLDLPRSDPIIVIRPGELAQAAPALPPPESCQPLGEAYSRRLPHLDGDDRLPASLRDLQGVLDDELKDFPPASATPPAEEWLGETPFADLPDEPEEELNDSELDAWLNLEPPDKDKK
jgi:FimV-like protein